MGGIYDDGTIVDEKAYNELYERCGSGVYEKALRFSGVIDPEKAVGLLLGENREEIPIR